MLVGAGAWLMAATLLGRDRIPSWSIRWLRYSTVDMLNSHFFCLSLKRCIWTLQPKVCRSLSSSLPLTRNDQSSKRPRVFPATPCPSTSETMLVLRPRQMGVVCSGRGPDGYWWWRRAMTLLPTVPASKLERDPTCWTTFLQLEWQTVHQSSATDTVPQKGLGLWWPYNRHRCGFGCLS